MKLNESFTYPGASVSDVYGLITDAAFREESCVRQHSTEYDVTVTGGDVKISRTMPAELPDFVKKIVGSTVKVTQTENWKPDGEAHIADIAVDISGQPAGMKGTVRIEQKGADTLFTINGDVKVSIPFLGKKIEPEVHKAIVASIRTEVEFGLTKL